MASRLARFAPNTPMGKKGGGTAEAPASAGRATPGPIRPAVSPGAGFPGPAALPRNPGVALSGRPPSGGRGARPAPAKASDASPEPPGAAGKTGGATGIPPEEAPGGVVDAGCAAGRSSTGGNGKSSRAQAKSSGPAMQKVSPGWTFSKRNVPPESPGAPATTRSAAPHGKAPFFFALRKIGRVRAGKRKATDPLEGPVHPVLGPRC